MDIGDPVKIEVGGVVMEGTLRFLGQVDGKEGNWGGVELDKEWAGKGKNDGSVKGFVLFPAFVIVWPECRDVPWCRTAIWIRRPESRVHGVDVGTGQKPIMFDRAY